MMKEGTASKLCIRTNNVKRKTWESDLMYVYFLLDASRMKDTSLIIAIA